MKFKRKTLKVVASLVLTLLMCLSIVPVSAMAMAEGEPLPEEPVITESVVEETTDTPTTPPVEESPAATPEPTQAPVATPEPTVAAVANANTATPTPAPTYTVEYKVDGASLKKEEGMAADTTFPAPPSGYEAYTWLYTDDSGNPQAFVWGDAAQPANIGTRDWELNGTAPADEPDGNTQNATASTAAGAPQIASNFVPSLGVNIQGGNPQVDTRTITFSAPVDGQQPVTTTVDLIADANGDAFVAQADLDTGLAALNAALAPYELEVTGWDGDYVGTLVGQEGLTINATVQSTAGDLSQYDHVVTFYANGAVYEEKGVNNNGTVSPPHTTPPVPQGMAAFKGWYLDEDGKNEYDFATEITSDFELYAVYSGTYLVQFLDAYGGVIQSQEVAIGEYATAPDAPEAANPGETFQFWYEQGDPSETPFDVENTPISSAIILAPMFSMDHYVFFDANGGTLNSEAFLLVPDGEFLEEPTEPSNTGYDFAFWSRDADATYEEVDSKKFEFDTTEITETITLYAIWEPQEVGYILNVWNEIANFDGDPGIDKSNYELVYTRVISPTNSGDAAMLGTAGQLLNNGTNDVITEDFINSRQYLSQVPAVYDILDYSDFAWTDAGTLGKELSGTGDTVINLYAKRIEFPIKISLNDARDKGGKNKIGSDVTITTRGNGTHTAAEGTYDFTIKLDQNISQVWPATYTVNDNTSYKFVNFSGYHGLATDTSIANKAYIRAGFFANGTTAVTGADGRIDISSGPATLYGNCNPSTIKEYRYYYTEASPERVAELGEGAFFPIGSAVNVTDLSSNAQTMLNDPMGHTLIEFNGKYYEYATRGPANGNYQSTWNPKGWPGGSVSGFRTIVRSADDAVYNTNYYQVALSALTTTSNNGTEDEGATRRGNICYFMPRAGYTLTLITGEGATIANAEEYGLEYNTTNGYTKILPYGETIDLTGLDVVGATPLDGWYTSESYTNKVTTATMPNKNMTLYAAYEGQFQPVTYYSKQNGDVVDHDTVKTGGKLPNLSIEYVVGQDYDGLGVFKGWGYIYPGTTYVQAYNTNIPVTGPLSLYGMWQTANLKLKYDANGGTGTAPTDTSGYKYNVLAKVQDSNGLTGPDGKVFIGWQIEGTGPIYYPGATITVKNNYTLYAKYVGESDGSLWKLNYHPNFDGATEASKEQTVLANSQVMPLGSGTFTRPGYSLIGWTTTEGGTTVDYGFTQAIDVSKDGMDLYAVWQKQPTLTVTFNVANDTMGYLDDAGTDKSTVERENIVKGTSFDAAVGTVPTPVAKEGYYFVGWTPKEPTRANYQFIQTNLTFTAQFAQKTAFDVSQLTIASQEKVYSASDLAYSFTNWPANIDSNHFDIGWSRVPGENVGTYTISVSVAPKPEYAYLYTMSGSVPSGTLTIKPLTLTLTAIDAGKVYGDNDPVPLTTVGMEYAKVQNPKAGFTKAEPVYSLSRQSGESIGKYDITVSADAAANANYTITTVPAIFTISAQGSPLVINMGSFEKLYGNADPTAAEVAATLTVSNLTGGDTADMLNLTVSRTLGEDVGTYNYTITYDETVAANYSGVTVNAGTLTITQRLVVLEANSYPAAGGTLYPSDARPAFTAFIHPDTPLAFDQTELMYSLYLTNYSGTGMPGAGTYTIGFNLDPTDPMNRNYYIVVRTGTLTVTEPTTPVTPEEGTPETPTTTPAPVAPVPGPGGGPAAIVPPVAEPAAPATTPDAPVPVATTPEEAPAGAQLVNLDGTDVPLANTTVGQWALVNLMVAVLTLVLGILMFVLMFKRNKKRDETEEEQQARMAAEAARGEEPEEDVRNRKSGLLWRVLSILAGILAPIVFLLTENMNNPMVLVDHWTLLMVAIFAIQVICMLLVRYARNRKDDPEEQYVNE